MLNYKHLEARKRGVEQVILKCGIAFCWIWVISLKKKLKVVDLR